MRRIRILIPFDKIADWLNSQLIEISECIEDLAKNAI